MAALPGTADEPFPDEIVIETAEGGRYDSVFARGYVRAPIAQVWDAFREPAVGADRRSSSEWSVETLDEEGYDESYVIYAVAYEIITVEWWTTWRHGVVEGPADAPEVVAIRWQKTEGNTILRVIEGSIVLRSVDAGAATELDFVYHASALGADLGRYRQYVEDVIADMRATIDGEMLASFD